MLGSAKDEVASLVQGNRRRAGPDRGFAVAVPRYQQYRVEQPAERLVTITADPDGAVRGHQDEGCRDLPGQLEEVIERVLGGHGQQRRALLVADEAGGDAVLVHVEAAGALPRGE